MSTKFYIADCPDTLAVYRWLEKETNLRSHLHGLNAPKDANGMLELTANGVFDLTALKDQVLNMSKNHGLHRWSAAGDTSAKDYYVSQSLVYNPDHIDQEQGIYNSTLGTTRNVMGEFYWNQMRRHEKIKNSYYDTYSFNRITPAASEGELGKLLGGFSRTLIRSRMSAIEPKLFSEEQRKMGPDHPQGNIAGWHKDEELHHNLRINIPIITDENFFIQLDDLTNVALKTGCMYSWDTHRAHRAYPGPNASITRINIVLGFSPWFDYLPNEKAWVANEFFGKVHPIEMLLSGKIHPAITRKNLIRLREAAADRAA